MMETSLKEWHVLPTKNSSLWFRQINGAHGPHTPRTQSEWQRFNCTNTNSNYIYIYRIFFRNIQWYSMIFHDISYQILMQGICLLISKPLQAWDSSRPRAALPSARPSGQRHEMRVWMSMPYILSTFGEGTLISWMLWTRISQQLIPVE